LAYNTRWDDVAGGVYDTVNEFEGDFTIKVLFAGGGEYVINITEEEISPELKLLVYPTSMDGGGIANHSFGKGLKLN